jgi:hypothetical protein
VKTLLMRVALIGALLVGASACSVDQLKEWYESNGVPYGHLSEGELAGQASAISQFFTEQAELSRFDWVLNEDQLWRLRQCESGGNYSVVNPSGTYRGAYQFSRSTWNYVAGIHFPKYVNVDPASAPPKVQDSMTRALWHMQGAAPWPVCGKRV